MIVLRPVCLAVSLLLVAHVVRASVKGDEDLRPSDKPKPQAGESKTDESANIPKLIDQLVKVKDSDFGYSQSVTGSVFTPWDTEGHFQTGLLFQKPPVQSGALRELVKLGVAALPHLVAHLDDKRLTGIKIEHNAPIGGLFFGDGMDQNGRTDKAITVKTPEAEQGDRLTAHTLTVGDLCYVAIGQIVNRRFDAVRYVPTAIVVVNSPTKSPALRERVKKAWGTVTREQHRAALVADFLKPDTDERRDGACKRLAYYYPDALEPLALKFLAQPTYDTGRIWDFVRKELYRAKTPEERRRLFDAHIAKHGEPARDGILLQLFEDLGTLEAHEEKRRSSPLTEFADQPRKLLIQLYSKKQDVKSQERPSHAESLSATAKVELIGEGLIYDRSEKIDRAVRDLLVSTESDDALATACMKRLVGRGFDTEIEKYCRGRLAKLTEPHEREELEGFLDKLGWTRLHVAVSRSQLDMVRELAQDKASINATARNGQTPLHLAVTVGNLEIVKTLVAAGAGLNPKNKAGDVPVQLAARNDHFDVVQYLGGCGCTVPDMLTAAALGRADVIDGLAKADKTQVKAMTEGKQSPLHLAAHFGHPKVAERLLAAGAPREEHNCEGLTPLHVAAAAGQDAVAGTLVKAGANVRARTEEGYEPVHLAAYHGRERAAAVLLDSGALLDVMVEKSKATPLHLAIDQGHDAVVKLFLKRGAPVEARDKDDLTPLHHAALHSRADAAKHLIAAHADVRSKDKEYGWTPLHVAAYQGDAAMVKLLLAHKAVATEKDKSEQTPLDLARENKHAEVVQLLEGKDSKR
jgi:ankyrin repeat protein